MNAKIGFIFILRKESLKLVRKSVKLVSGFNFKEIKFANKFSYNEKVFISILLSALSLSVNAQNMENPNLNTSVAPLETLNLTQEWVNTFKENE